MQEILLLPAPKPKKHRRWYLFPLFCACFVIIVALLSSLFRQPEILANISFQAFEQQMKDQQDSMLSALLESKNDQEIAITLDGQPFLTLPLSTLGLQFSWSQEEVNYKDVPVVSAFFEPLDESLKSSAPTHTRNAQLSIDRDQWGTTIDNLKAQVERDPEAPEILWNESEGWHLKKAVKGVEISEASIDESYVKLVSHLQYHHEALTLDLTTRPVSARFDQHERRRVNRLYQQIKDRLSTPLTIEIGDEEIVLDLKKEANLVILNDEDFEINTTDLTSRLQQLAEEYGREPSEVRIVGTEKNSRGVLKGIVEGEFIEGARLNVEESLEQVKTALENGDERVRLRLYEIPVKVFSELENTSYDLLAVGYSEYSKGNAPNRVHNIETGLSRIDRTLIKPGQEISFNKSNGPINNDFRVGYAIMGNVATPSLGGGICQVSTTFYRSLLNLGVPITQRQNHSWDLSYYQAGGYGLDATIYPSAGLDVKAMNDYDSSLFMYSYNRPDSEEAFVLVYGVKDGRQVTLEPEEEYIPWRGAKTLKWSRTIEFPDGTSREHQIVSRYRS